MNFVFEDIENLKNFLDCTDINGSGINRVTVSPVASTIIRYHQVKEKFKNIDFSDVKISNNPESFEKYIIASGVTHSPYDWCGPDFKNNGYDHKNTFKKNLFRFLSEKYLQDLRSGKAFLLLDQSHEGYHADWLFDWFHSTCQEYSINPKQIIYVTGDLDVAAKYNEWANRKNFSDRCLMVPYAHFENAVYNSAMDRVRFLFLDKLPTFKDHLSYKKKHLDKIKIYNALQKRPRAHRMWLFKELYFASLLDDGINSMNSFDLASTYYMNRTMQEEDYKKFIDLLPMLPPTNETSEKELQDFSNDDSGKYQMRFNDDIMLDTWVSVISEASFGEDTCFISEKTFKPIAACHPFIVYGNKKSLHYLKDLGYKTFHPYIDETYDNLDTWERLDAIVSSLKKIKEIPKTEKIKWFEGMKEILEHNYEILRKNSVDNVPACYVTIKKYFGK